MPKIRIGFATDLNLVNEQVGIGTTLPTARLDVRGQIRADNSAGSGGISTFTAYDGFLHSQQAIRNNISIAETTKGNLNSLSGEIVISGEVTVTAGTSIGGGRLDSLTVTGTFDLPRGGSANREVTPEKGSTRFNQDLGQLEFYTGYEWRTVSSYDGSGRGRGVFGGGNNGPGEVYNIDYINIATTGNSLDFGTIASSVSRKAGCSDSTRGIFGGGAPASNVIDYLTIASSGNTIDFGDLTAGRYAFSACSSSTRGVFGGGFTVPTGSRNIIDYVQISTLGNALDFGDLISARFGVFSCSSPTRGVFGGGTPGNIKTIEFITISSTGNAVTFGNLTDSKTYGSGCSSSTRGVFGGGTPASNIIEYITIASTGNSIDFGDLTVGRETGSNAVSNSVRGVFGSGYTGPLSTNINNTIDYITIASIGNAIDFGDMSNVKGYYGAISDSHGGLGGF